MLWYLKHCVKEFPTLYQLLHKTIQRIVATMYKQLLQRIILPISVLRELQDLPNNNTEDERNPNLLNIPVGLRDLLRVFLGRRAKVLLQNLKYNYAINLEEGKQLLNLSIYNLSYKELKILQEYLNGLLERDGYSLVSYQQAC